MPFDVERFQRSTFEPRTAVIQLDPTIALAEFFGEGEAIAWKVRSLSGIELYQANEAADKQKARLDVSKALASTSDERVKAIRETLGLGAIGATPAEMAKRMEMFVFGSVSPTVDLAMAVKFAEAFPVEFQQVTQQIAALTGQGFDLVKPAAASQPMTASEPQ